MLLFTVYVRSWKTNSIRSVQNKIYFLILAQFTDASRTRTFVICFHCVQSKIIVIHTELNWTYKHIHIHIGDCYYNRLAKLTHHLILNMPSSVAVFFRGFKNRLVSTFLYCMTMNHIEWMNPLSKCEMKLETLYIYVYRVYIWLRWWWKCKTTTN